MEEQVDNMLKRGVIGESTSPWSAPALLVPKKSLDGKLKYRFCVNFRALNKVTKFDSYPLPLLDDATASPAGSQYFSVLDCHSGFWQIEIREEDKEKTAFLVPSGHCDFNRLLFGLSNSRATFERLIELILAKLTGKECWVFVDDTIVFGCTACEHAERLAHVLERFEKANLRLQPKKCTSAASKLEYLGHVPGRDGVRP
jgi:hypothetical protein